MVAQSPILLYDSEKSNKDQSASARIPHPVARSLSAKTNKFREMEPFFRNGLWRQDCSSVLKLRNEISVFDFAESIPRSVRGRHWYPGYHWKSSGTLVKFTQGGKGPCQCFLCCSNRTGFPKMESKAVSEPVIARRWIKRHCASPQHLAHLNPQIGLSLLSRHVRPARSDEHSSMRTGFAGVLESRLIWTVEILVVRSGCQLQFTSRWIYVSCKVLQVGCQK